MPDTLSKKQTALFMSGLMGLFAVAATIHSTIGVMLSFYISEYSLEAGNQGLLGTAESVGFIASLFLMAFLLRKLPKAKVLLLTAFGISAIMILIGLKPGVFAVLFLIYLLFGISYGIFDSLSSSLMSDVFPGTSGKKMSYMRAVYCLGGMVAPLIQNALLKQGLEWNRVVLLLGIIGIAVFLFYFSVSHPRIPELSAAQKRNDKVTLRGYLDFLKVPGVLRALLFGVLYYGHQIGLTMWVVRYVTNYLHEEAWGSFALTLYWIGMLVSRIFLPQIISSHRTLLLYGNLVSMLFVTFGILSGNGKIFCVMILLAGLSEGTTIPMLVDYACSFDRSRSATACSIVVFFNNLGSMFIPSLIGALISAVGASTGIFVLPATSLGCALLAIGMKKENNK